MYWDSYAFANNLEPDQMPQNVASDQGLHCLPLIHTLDYQQVVKLTISNFRTSMVRSRPDT